MRNSVLKRTDGRTDREKSAIVELRFAAKNDQIPITAFWTLLFVLFEKLLNRYSDFTVLTI